MANNKSVTGCLIERKGKYYVVVSYYVDGYRLQDTKSTGISITSHKKREAEKIKDRLIQEKEKELEQLAREKTRIHFQNVLKSGLIISQHRWKVQRHGDISARAKQLLNISVRKISRLRN